MTTIFHCNHFCNEKKFEDSLGQQADICAANGLVSLFKKYLKKDLKIPERVAKQEQRRFAIEINRSNISISRLLLGLIVST